MAQLPNPAQRRRRQLGGLLLLVTVLGAGLVGQWLSSRAQRGPATAAPVMATDPGGGAAPVMVAGGPGLPTAPPTATSPTAERAQWQERLQNATERLATYRSWARYPPDSRPASEHRDRLQPTGPVSRTLPMSQRGSPSQNVRLQLGQDRLILVGSESARLSVRCEDSLGTVLPCTVVSARALPLVQAPAGGMNPPSAPVHFSDDGRGGDAVAGDGTLTATLQPARLGFGSYLGPLRVELSLRAGVASADDGEAGDALFDLSYTPNPPSILTGRVREAVEEGSLCLYLGIEVRTAGRYVLAARVDDMSGKAFAYLPWNDELTVGPHEIKLTVFGKLILDGSPAMPLRLRDVDGFLLKEDGDPDREHLPMLAGYVHTTSVYPRSVFSADEWHSEERDRHEKQFSSEVDEAQGELNKLPGAGAGTPAPH